MNVLKEGIIYNVKSYTNCFYKCLSKNDIHYESFSICCCIDVMRTIFNFLIPHWYPSLWIIFDFWWCIDIHHCGAFPIFGAINIQHCIIFDTISIFITGDHFRFLITLIFSIANYLLYQYSPLWTIFDFWCIDIRHCGLFSIFSAINIQHCRLLLISYQYSPLWSIFDFWWCIDIDHSGSFSIFGADFKCVKIQ